MGSSGQPLLEVGWIGTAHGLKGEVVVGLVTDRTERVEVGSELFGPDDVSFVVRSARPHKTAAERKYVIRFAGVDSREAADALRGTKLFAEPLDDPSVLWVHELVGRPLREVDGTVRGVVEAVEANPASDIMVLDTGALVPLNFVVETDGDAIVVDVPDGLFDLNVSGDDA